LATNFYKLRGTLKWAKVYEPDSFMNAENYKIAFYPLDEKEWDKFKATGLELKIKDDTDGVSGKFVTFRRPTKKLIKDDLVIFTPPEITGLVNVSYEDENGNKIRSYNKADKLKIKRVGNVVELGNGTEAIVNFCVYDTVKGKGHRLESIRVLQLVEFEREDYEQEKETVVETKIEKKKSTVSEDLNDDIPFGDKVKDSLPW